MGPSSDLDTRPGVDARLAEHWRAMPPAAHLGAVAALNESVARLAEAGVRRRHPQADDRQVWLRTTALRLGRDLMVSVYGWDPDIEGW